jgi:hypothetical protein
MASYDEDVECWSAGVPGARNLEVARAEGADSWVTVGWLVHVDEDVMMFMRTLR